jgi:hypothetical protein
MDIDSPKKTGKIYRCESCNLVTSNKKDYTKHNLTAKHLKSIERYIKISKKPDLTCECGKSYKHYSGLWRHKKICIIEENTIGSIIKDNNDFKNLIIQVVKNNAELQKQNQEFQKQMMELYKAGNTTVNSHNNNKTFNMQIFLNEKCKDAMNLVDFVNSMTLELEDLEEVGKLGYVEGISNIMIRKLNALDVHKRPIHCSDAKREIMFVKDDNIWAKENSTYDKLRKAIKSVTYKNSALLGPWSEKYPNCLNNQHHLNDVYVQMLGQAMGGKESFLESENKIMKKIAKAVLIEKN